MSMEVVIGMSLFSEHFMTYGTIFVSYEEDVQEWYAIVLFNHHCELDVIRYAIEMVQKVFKFIFSIRPINTGVIHKSNPKFRLVSRAFFSKFSMKTLATIGERGDPIATPEYCSKISPWKEKKVDHRQISANFVV